MSEDRLALLRDRNPQLHDALATSAALHAERMRALEALEAAATNKRGWLVAEREGVKAVNDFLADEISRAEAADEISRAEGLAVLRDGRVDVVQGFVRRLYDILSKPPAEVHCQWSADGRSVVILDEDAFARDVCPRYYSHSNFSSFDRLMNMYQFVKGRKRRGDRSRRRVFAHEHFLRGREDLLVHLQHVPHALEKLVARNATIERTEKARLLVERPASVEAATTMREYLGGGGNKRDLMNDIEGGYFRVSSHAELERCRRRVPHPRCGACEGCTADECGTCKYCLDKPKRGGTNKLNRPCVHRRCEHLPGHRRRRRARVPPPVARRAPPPPHPAHAPPPAAPPLPRRTRS